MHIPFCKSRCAYCSFVSSTDTRRQQLYVDSLIKEIRLRAEGRKVDSVYIGGGTPSMLKDGLLTQIFTALRQEFQIEDTAEITVEANPDSFTASFASECSGLVNRLSLGLQSTNDEILNSINRPHKYADFLRAMELAQKANIKNISCDLMLGLPQDNLKGVQSSLTHVLDLPIKHLSLYGLKLEENTPLHKSGYVTDDDLQADMYDLCYKTLKDHNFMRYEVSNFAISGYESKHNLKYWSRSPYIGFGVAAHSFYDERRYESTDNLSNYIIGSYQSEHTIISKPEQAEEYIMLSLRTRYGIQFSKALEYGVDLLKTKGKQINKLLKQKMIEVSDCGIVLCENAYYIMNSIILELL